MHIKLFHLALFLAVCGYSAAATTSFGTFTYVPPIFDAPVTAPPPMPTPTPNPNPVPAAVAAASDSTTSQSIVNSNTKNAGSPQAVSSQQSVLPQNNAPQTPSNSNSNTPTSSNTQASKTSGKGSSGSSGPTSVGDTSTSPTKTTATSTSDGANSNQDKGISGINESTGGMVSSTKKGVVGGGIVLGVGCICALAFFVVRRNRRADQTAGGKSDFDWSTLRKKETVYGFYPNTPTSITNTRSSVTSTMRPLSDTTSIAFTEYTTAEGHSRFSHLTNGIA